MNEALLVSVRSCRRGAEAWNTIVNLRRFGIRPVVPIAQDDPHQSSTSMHAMSAVIENTQAKVTEAFVNL